MMIRKREKKENRLFLTFFYFYFLRIVCALYISFNKKKSCGPTHSAKTNIRRLIARAHVHNFQQLTDQWKSSLCCIIPLWRRHFCVTALLTNRCQFDEI